MTLPVILARLLMCELSCLSSSRDCSSDLALLKITMYVRFAGAFVNIFISNVVKGGLYGTCICFKG